MDGMNRVAIFGGTFDPIHLAHLILAERAREELALDQVIFLPAAVPPHKQDRGITDGKFRREMIDIAIAGNPTFVTSDLELKRTGVSYTVDTLRDMAEAHPAAELFLVVGGDMLADIPNWREPDEIVRRVTLIVGARPGHEVPSPPLPEARIRIVTMPLLEVSSTDIRQRVAARQSIRYMIPAGVEAYIHAHQLYRES